MTDHINILGEEYKIVVKPEKQDDGLKDNYSYCDPSIKQIVICTLNDLRQEGSLADLDDFRNHCIRHEIIHAALYESGLYTNCDFAMDEEMIDWVSLQFHKLRKIFEELGI